MHVVHVVHMEEVKFTMAVRGEDRIKAFDALVAGDHSSRIAVLNKALDLLVEHEAKLKRLTAGVELEHA